MIKKIIKDGKQKINLEYFQALVKVYTGALYPKIGELLSKNNFSPLGFYFASLIECLNIWTDKVKNIGYQEFH